MQRFQLCASQPAYFTPNEIMSADPNYCAIQKVFFAVYIIHKDHFQYKLSDEAEQYFNALYLENKNLVKKCNLYDSFLRYFQLMSSLYKI